MRHVVRRHDDDGGAAQGHPVAVRDLILLAIGHLDHERNALVNGGLHLVSGHKSCRENATPPQSNQVRLRRSLITHTRGTVEEKILSLQQKKRAIIKATLGGEETLADNLTWEAIQGLFE